MCEFKNPFENLTKEEIVLLIYWLINWDKLEKENKSV